MVWSLDGCAKRHNDREVHPQMKACSPIIFIVTVPHPKTIPWRIMSPQLLVYVCPWFLVLVSQVWAPKTTSFDVREYYPNLGFQTTISTTTKHTNHAVRKMTGIPRFNRFCLIQLVRIVVDVDGMAVVTSNSSVAAFVSEQALRRWLSLTQCFTSSINTWCSRIWSRITTERSTPRRVRTSR